VTSSFSDDLLTQLTAKPFLWCKQAREATYWCQRFKANMYIFMYNNIVKCHLLHTQAYNVRWATILLYIYRLLIDGHVEWQANKYSNQSSQFSVLTCRPVRSDEFNSICLFSYLQCESKTRGSIHNFGRCWPIFKIIYLSLLDSAINLQQDPSYIPLYPSHLKRVAASPCGMQKVKISRNPTYRALLTCKSWRTTRLTQSTHQHRWPLVIAEFKRTIANKRSK